MLNSASAVCTEQGKVRSLVSSETDGSQPVGFPRNSRMKQKKARRYYLRAFLLIGVAVERFVQIRRWELSGASLARCVSRWTLLIPPFFERSLRAWRMGITPSCV